MLSLDATTKTLEVKLAALITTNQLPIVVSYVDINQSTFAQTASSESDTATNGTTVVTIIAAPGATTTRKLNYLSIFNADTLAATVTVQVNNNATLRIIFKVTLAVGDNLIYIDGIGFQVIDSNGQQKKSSPVGAIGPTGFTGFPGWDGDDGLDSYIPGPAGAAGVAGSSGSALVYIAKTANYTAVANDFVAFTGATTATLTLPAASSNANKVVVGVNNGTGTITIGRTGADTIGLATSQTLNPGTATSQGDSMTFTSDGISNWNIT